MRSTVGSYICSNAYGRWFVPRVRHSVRMTYRLSAALRLLGSLRISHKKFSCIMINKEDFTLLYSTLNATNPLCFNRLCLCDSIGSAD